MDINKLREKIIEKGMSVENVAVLIGMNKSSLYRKLNSYEKITIGEALRIKTILRLTNAEACDIFFT